MKKITFHITGMHCTGCANNLEKQLKKLKGVQQVQVHFASEKAELHYRGPLASSATDDAIAAIAALGFQGTVITKSLFPLPLPLSLAEDQQQLALTGKIAFILASIVISISLMLWEMYQPTGHQHHQASIVVNFILSSIFLLVIGRRYLQAIGRFLRLGVADMDTLVGIGTTTAYSYSAMIFLFPTLSAQLGLPSQYYFDATIMIIGMIQIGKYLEARAKAKTNQAIAQLINLQSKNALIEVHGEEQEIPIERLEVGDLCLIKPGSKIPADGQVLAGSSSVEEALITGEALPIDKREGDFVIGGTINRQGFLKVRIQKVGTDTLLAHIIQTVEEAMTSKAPIQKLADQISAIFVPTVMLIALCTLVGWLSYGYWWAHDLPRFIPVAISSLVSVLVIACPCALGLATPLGIIVGTGIASRRGILIKNAESLQKLHQVTVMAFDKTGTITKGRPELIDLVPLQIEGPLLLGILKALEQKSEHPLARAIVDHPAPWPLPKLEAEDFTILEGKGISGRVAGQRYFAGNLHLLNETLGPRPEILAMLESYLQAGKTPVILFNQQDVLGFATVADQIKDQTAQMIDDLEKLKIKLVMLTGDHQNVANYIAKQVGIFHVLADLLPQDKARWIGQQKQQQPDPKKLIAMIGDGINDAPALAAADVSIAMATGSDIAIEAADITLLKGNLAKIVSAIQISKYTMRKIKQNLFWAFVYNLVLIPIACGIFYLPFDLLMNPILAGAAMSISSLSVVGNTLLMKYFHPQ